MRMITKRTRLYTEMYVDKTLLYQKTPEDLAKFLRFDRVQHPIAVQLGGNDPESLGKAAELCREYKYDEIDLNCGCPSKTVSKNMFGAKLMLRPHLVRRICHEMIRRVGHDTPVTVKCRLGADDCDTYEELLDFVRIVKTCGVEHFIFHARKCLLNGLSTKKNRSVPPLKYDWVHRLKKEFPDLRVSLNGGVKSLDVTARELNLSQSSSSSSSSSPVSSFPHNRTDLDSVMIGRGAWHNPWMLSNVDTKIFGEKKNPSSGRSRRDVILEYSDYVERLIDEADPKQRKPRISTFTGPVANLVKGIPGGKQFKHYIFKNLTTKSQRTDFKNVMYEGFEKFFSTRTSSTDYEDHASIDDIVLD
jgi:tRNA-dihydrouridine synthase A